MRRDLSQSLICVSVEQKYSFTRVAGEITYTLEYSRSEQDNRPRTYHRWNEPRKGQEIPSVHNKGSTLLIFGRAFSPEGRF